MQKELTLPSNNLKDSSLLKLLFWHKNSFPTKMQWYKFQIESVNSLSKLSLICRVVAQWDMMHNANFFRRENIFPKSTQTCEGAPERNYSKEAHSSSEFLRRPQKFAKSALRFWHLHQSHATFRWLLCCYNSTRASSTYCKAFKRTLIYTVNVNDAPKKAWFSYWSLQTSILFFLLNGRKKIRKHSAP